jgi:hypothetical protein
MTVIVASASPDGIALAGDSRTIQQEGTHYRVASNVAQKVFEAGGRIGVATYGLAMIERNSIRGLFDGWAVRADANRDLRTTAESLGRFFHDRLDAATPARRGDLLRGRQGWPLGFLVAGYDDGVGQVLEIRVRSTDFEVGSTDVSTSKPSTLYRGETGVIRRLIKGVDLGRIDESQLDDDTRARLQTAEYSLIDPVTAQDAVDFAFFLIRTTIEMQRFSDGTYGERHSFPWCGGEPQGLVVSPGGVQWIRRAALLQPPDPGRMVPEDV